MSLIWFWVDFQYCITLDFIQFFSVPGFKKNCPSVLHGKGWNTCQGKCWLKLYFVFAIIIGGIKLCSLNKVWEHIMQDIDVLIFKGSVHKCSQKLFIISTWNFQWLGKCVNQYCDFLCKKRWSSVGLKISCDFWHIFVNIFSFKNNLPVFRCTKNNCR